MTVAHVSLARGFRGGEQQAYYLMDALAQRGQDQVLIARRGEPLLARVADIDPGGSIQRIGVGGRREAARALVELQSRASRGAGVVLAHAHDGHAHTAAWLASLAGGAPPYVVSRRVLRSPGRVYWSAQKYARGHLRALLCVSEAVAETHRRQLGTRAPRIEVVYDAGRRLDGERVPPLREELGLGADTLIVGTVAALAPEKDVATFVKTCASVAERHPAAHFVHIGGGPAAAAAELDRLSAAAGLGGRLHALGFRRDAPAAIGAFDVFLFTSRWEGLGSALLEAQLRDVPVVSTAAGGTVELIEHGVSGMLAPVGASEVLAQAVTQLLDDPTLRGHLTRGARAQLSRFTADALAEATLAAYARALAGE